MDNIDFDDIKANIINLFDNVKVLSQNYIEQIKIVSANAGDKGREFWDSLF